MGQYNFLNSIANDKMFIVNRSKLDLRFDSSYYSPKFTEQINKIKRLKHIRLSTRIKTLETGYNNEQNFNSNGHKFIRTQNIKPVNLNFKNISYTTDKQIRTPNKGTLFFTRIGVGVGDVAFNKFDDLAISDNVISVDFKDEMFSNYCAIYLNTKIGKTFIEREKRDTARAIISYGNIRNILIPDIDRSQQLEIIELYNNAYQVKLDKEQEIKNLLKSIDSYILEELSIELKEEENNLQSRIFKVNFSDVSGLRIDPEMTLYSQKISESKYPLIPLGQLLKEKPQYGANEAGINRLDKDSPRYIRITDIDSNGFLKKGLGKTTEIIEEQYFLNHKDILFARSGNTVGKTYIHNKEKVDYQCFFAGYMIRFIVDEHKISPDFLFAYTQTKPYKDWVKAIQRTAGQPNINAEEYKSLNIPLPPLEKQKKIAVYINELRAKIRLLQHTTENDFEIAKQEVEQLILNNKV